MTAQALTRTLTKLGACKEARKWATGKTLATAWLECQRGDWLLWLCAEQIGEPGWPTHQAVVLAVCACAEVALVYVPAGENRPRLAIEAARKWARGEATVAEVRAAAYAAHAAAHAAARPLSLAHSADLVRSMLTIPDCVQETP